MKNVILGGFFIPLLKAMRIFGHGTFRFSVFSEEVNYTHSYYQDYGGIETLGRKLSIQKFNGGLRRKWRLPCLD